MTSSTCSTAWSPAASLMARSKLRPGWARIPFGELAACVNDRVDNPEDAGVSRYVGLEHLDPDSLVIRRWGSPDDVSATKLLFRHGDIIFGRRRVYQRKVAVASFEGICSAHAMVLRPRAAAVVPQFLPFFMQSDLFMNRAIMISVGSLSPTINWTTLAQETFALPPRKEQLRIAELLEAGVAMANLHLDAASLTQDVADSLLTRHLADPLSHARLYNHDFGFHLPRIPLVPLGDLMTTAQYGISLPTVSGGRYPMLRMTNLENGLTTRTDIAFVDLADEDYAKYRLLNGDILFNRTNSHELVGRTAIHRIAGPCVFASYLIRIRLQERDVLPEYLCAFLNHHLGKRQVMRFATRGVSQSNVNIDSLRRILLPLPELDYQRMLVNELETLRSAGDALRRRARDASHFVCVASIRHLGDSA